MIGNGNTVLVLNYERGNNNNGNAWDMKLN
jgi:hypothetical protein